jgi:hypothetical protein
MYIPEKKKMFCFKRIEMFLMMGKRQIKANICFFSKHEPIKLRKH